MRREDEYFQEKNRNGYYQQCEAPSHVAGCNGKGTTVDHFTPKCVARELGWTKDMVESWENKQYLSEACHKAKDKDTPARAALVRYQEKQGHEVKFGEHEHLLHLFSSGKTVEERQKQKEKHQKKKRTIYSRSKRRRH